ncbi:hypothetical protein RI129_010222 [Pyrocoelia pectoralis]|uniref:Uncharacterized protein n=1 Tax=Pyrocoelia pectoralis TaxID=417401 RepID=A0AAN7ZD29_9COLE
MNANKNEQANSLEMMAPFVKPKRLEPDEVNFSNQCLRNLSLYFSQYCDSTSIHGIKYVGQRGRYLLEKLLWLVIVIGVFTICSILIHKTYRKWQTSPVIVTFSTTEKPISDIPFPAVTICPEAKFDTEIFNFTDIVLKRILNQRLSEEDEMLFDTFSMVCNIMFHITDFETFNKTIDDLSVLGFLKVLPLLDPHNMSTTKWLGKELNILDEVLLTFTSEGLCYTFNMLPYDEVLRDADDYITQSAKTHRGTLKWSLDEGYPPGDYLGSYPRRTFLSGLEGGLVIDGLHTNHSHLDYLCGESLQGFKVALHHPCELPNMEKHFRLPLDEAVFVGIKPKMITISEDLIGYKPEDRKCYLGNEKFLSLYKYYTQENCLSECLANYTLQQCGCLAFYMPTTTSTETCGLGSMECVKNSKVKYLDNETYSEFGLGLCNCLPSCTSLSYDVETSQTRWDWRKAFKVLHRAGLSEGIPDDKESHYSRLHVYYKDLQFLSSERNELYGYVDFFSNVGGLLGLFIGLSVTSCIEILYFLTLRLVCNIRKYGRHVWSGEPDLINSKDE